MADPPSPSASPNTPIDSEASLSTAPLPSSTTSSLSPRSPSPSPSSPCDSLPPSCDTAPAPVPVFDINQYMRDHWAKHPPNPNRPKKVLQFTANGRGKMHVPAHSERCPVIQDVANGAEPSTSFGTQGSFPQLSNGNPTLPSAFPTSPIPNGLVAPNPDSEVYERNNALLNPDNAPFIPRSI